MTGITRAIIWSTGYWAALAVMLALALYLRTADLMDVQHFQGDQGRDYVEVMKWIKDGHWPLVGPLRVMNDFTLGPGWYYTIAPAMALSGFYPTSGAATVAVLSVLTIFLIADWLRRSTGSRAAALTTAAVMAFSTQWTTMARTLWSPHVLPLGVVGLAWLIAAVKRRPAPALAGALMLMAILPQWHTPGLLVDAAALPMLVMAFWQAWPLARATRCRNWLVWGFALLVVVGVLYIPPILYELQPGPGNIASFFSKVNLPAAPYPGSLGWRAWLAFDRLLWALCYRAFSGNMTALPAVRLALAAMLGAGFLFFFTRGFVPSLRDSGCGGAPNPTLKGGADVVSSLRDNPRPNAQLFLTSGIDWSAGYLALLVAGYWLLLFLKGSAIDEYYMISPEPALLLLAGWTAGRMLSGLSDVRRDGDIKTSAVPTGHWFFSRPNPALKGGAESDRPCGTEKCDMASFSPRAIDCDMASLSSIDIDSPSNPVPSGTKQHQPHLSRWGSRNANKAESRQGRHIYIFDGVSKIIGAALLLFALTLTALQFPEAWAIHEGQTPDQFSFRRIRKVAEYIARDSGGRPFSVALAEQNNSIGHYFYLLRWLGRPPLNDNLYGRFVARAQMGERIYIIADPLLSLTPKIVGLSGEEPPPLPIAQVPVHCIETRRLPADTGALVMEFGRIPPSGDDIPWTIRALSKSEFQTLIDKQ